MALLQRQGSESEEIECVHLSPPLHDLHLEIFWTAVDDENPLTIKKKVCKKMQCTKKPLVWG